MRHWFIVLMATFAIASLTGCNEVSSFYSVLLVFSFVPAAAALMGSIYTTDALERGPTPSTPYRPKPETDRVAIVVLIVTLALFASTTRENITAWYRLFGPMFLVGAWYAAALPRIPNENKILNYAFILYPVSVLLFSTYWIIALFGWEWAALNILVAILIVPVWLMHLWEKHHTQSRHHT